MFNNDDDNENINIEKILSNNDILKGDYSFEEEEDRDEAILKKILIMMII